MINRAILAALLLVLIGCGAVTPPEVEEGIRLHLPAEPDTLNPVLYTDVYSAAVFGYVYESLLERDPDTLEFRPLLAENWQVYDGGLRYRFHLKKDVRWSDGEPFTADDVVYSYRIIMDPQVASARLKVYYREIREVRKIDRHTVDFIMERPYFMSLDFCGGMTIIPEHIFNDGTDFNTHKANRHPLGTGPYIFKEWSTGKGIVLRRNDAYHGEKPDLETIQYRFVSEQSVALQMLKKGTLDYMDIRAIQWVRQTNSDKFEENFYKIQYYTPNYRFLAWNMRKAPFNDRRVRHALTRMVNREDILEKLYFGLGKIVTGNFYIDGPYYDSSITPIAYDPAGARKLLEEAGWRDSDGDGIIDKDGTPFRFTITIPSGTRSSERIATIVKENLANVGIEMNINRYEWAVFLQKVNERDFDAVMLGWSFGFESDPYQVWHSSQRKEGSNFCGFADSEADGIIEAARSELDRNRRAAMYKRLHRIIHEAQPYTFLFCTPELKVVSRRFENVIIHKTGLDLREWRRAE